MYFAQLLIWNHFVGRSHGTHNCYGRFLSTNFQPEYRIQFARQSWKLSIHKLQTEMTDLIKKLSQLSSSIKAGLNVFITSFNANYINRLSHQRVNLNSNAKLHSPARPTCYIIDIFFIFSSLSWLSVSCICLNWKFSRISQFSQFAHLHWNIFFNIEIFKLITIMH